MLKAETKTTSGFALWEWTDTNSTERFKLSEPELYGK